MRAISLGMKTVLCLLVNFVEFNSDSTRQSKENVLQLAIQKGLNSSSLYFGFESAVHFLANEETSGRNSSSVVKLTKLAEFCAIPRKLKKKKRFL